MDLTDQQWTIIEPLFEEKRRPDGRGRPWRDARAVHNGVLWVLRTGAPWHDLPDRYPPYQTYHRRFQQWRKNGVFRDLLTCLAEDLRLRGKIDLTEGFIDASFTAAKKGLCRMSDAGFGEVAALLRAWHGGDEDAYRQVSSILYRELRDEAARRMRYASGTLFQATALVHETFIRLAGAHHVDWQDRRHFLAVAGRTMRRVLVDLVRAHAAEKRGAGAVHVPLDSGVAAGGPLRSLSDDADSFHRLHLGDSLRGLPVALEVVSHLLRSVCAEIENEKCVQNLQEYVHSIWHLRSLRSNLLGGSRLPFPLSGSERRCPSRYAREPFGDRNVRPDCLGGLSRPCERSLGTKH